MKIHHFAISLLNKIFFRYFFKKPQFFVAFLIFISMIEQILQNKYGESLKALDIYETKTSLILSRVIVNPETREVGVGTSVMEDLEKYADEHGQIIALTPSSDFGGNVNRLVQFYKRFGFVKNLDKSKTKHLMVRMPM